MVFLESAQEEYLTWYHCTCSVWLLMKFIVVNFISPRKFVSPIEVNHHIFGNHTALVQGYQVVPHGELIAKIPPFRPYIFFRRTRFQDFRAVAAIAKHGGSTKVIFLIMV